MFVIFKMFLILCCCYLWWVYVYARAYVFIFWSCYFKYTLNIFLETVYRHQEIYWLDSGGVLYLLRVHTKLCRHQVSLEDKLAKQHLEFFFFLNKIKITLTCIIYVRKYTYIFIYVYNHICLSKYIHIWIYERLSLNHLTPSNIRLLSISHALFCGTLWCELCSVMKNKSST